VSEPEVEKARKGKKPRKAGVVTEHRSRRVIVYTNRNKPVVSDVAGAIPHFDDDAEECAVPDMDKGAGNPVPHPDGASWTDRLSPSRVTGQAAPSVGDHNTGAWQDPMNQPGPKALAMGHPDMRQSTTNVLPLFTTRTEADMFPADLRGASHGVPVALARLDAASASGMSGPPANPAARPMDHIAPNNVSGPNGGHGLADAQSRAVALKGSEAREMLKRHMFGGSGPR